MTNGFGWAHAKRVAEAVLIATNTVQFLTLTDTAQLTELKAFHESLPARPTKGMTMTTAAEVTIERIQASLTRHADRGNIRQWERVPDAARPQWTVTLHDGVPLDLWTPREAHTFICGLRSADEAAAARRPEDECDGADRDQ